MSQQKTLLATFLRFHICFLTISALQLHRSSKGVSRSVKKPMVIGGIFPQFTPNNRFYKVDVFQAHLIKEALPRSTPFLQYYGLSPETQQATVSLSETSYPMDVIQALCGVLVPKRVTAIIYVSASEKYGLATASSQYLLHMLSYTGIPVIAWNADNSGLLVNRDFAKYKLLQTAPPIEHQVQAMVKLLERYSWSKFAVVTTTLAGHQYFVQLLRKEASDVSERKFKLDLVKEIVLDAKNTTDIESKLGQLVSSEGRIFLFYATHGEAESIFPVADRQGLTGRDYLWIGTQSVVSNFKTRPPSFQVGMLAIHFDTSTRYRSSLREQTENILVPAIKNAVNILVAGLNLLVNDYNSTLDLLSTASCDTDANYTWQTGEILYKYLKRASIDTDSGDPQRPKLRVKFDKSGKLKDSYLSIVNLKPNRNWEKVGYYTHGELGIYDITWPGRETHPPKGTPEKYHMKIVTLEEPPFLMISDMPSQSDSCPTGQKLCQWSENDGPHPNSTTVHGHLLHGNESSQKCCRGFCVDLLNKLTNDVGFTYDLYRVEDGKWGIKKNGTWNGLMADLVNHKADMCMTALKINTDRQKDIDFSVPFHETGIAILVALRRGALSPTAFLEPFEYSTWVFMLVIIIQASAFAIFIFEWLSPQSFNMARRPPPGHKFSLLRAYWLVWATFFSASVNTDVPRSHTSRFMALVWAACCMTFLAVYTANLAAFMITRTEYYDLTGISDPRITNPRDVVPPFIYGTIYSGNTEDTLRKNYRKLYNYIAKDNRFFKENVSDGVSAVKTGEYDAFIYDAVVLEYLSSKDDYCEILTAGSWFSMTGYGVGFPKNSKWLTKVNKHLLRYQELGELERLQNFWFSGSCAPRHLRDHMKHSTPLGIENFVSAFVLLACGTMFCLIILSLEYVYWNYVRRRLARTDKSGWCGLISLSMARSLSFSEMVEKVHAELKAQKRSSTRGSSRKLKDEKSESAESPILPSQSERPPSSAIRFQPSETPSGGKCFYAGLKTVDAAEEKGEREAEF